MDPTVTTTDPNSLTGIWDSMTSVFSTGLIAGTANVVNNALSPSPNASPSAPSASVGFSSLSGSSGITMVIALAIVGFFVMKALKK